jgi:hypothetical protein
LFFGILNVHPTLNFLTSHRTACVDPCTNLKLLGVRRMQESHTVFWSRSSIDFAAQNFSHCPDSNITFRTDWG